MSPGTAWWMWTPPDDRVVERPAPGADHAAMTRVGQPKVTTNAAKHTKSGRLAPLAPSASRMSISTVRCYPGRRPKTWTMRGNATMVSGSAQKASSSTRDRAERAAVATPSAAQRVAHAPT